MGLVPTVRTTLLIKESLESNVVSRWATDCGRVCSVHSGPLSRQVRAGLIRAELIDLVTKWQPVPGWPLLSCTWLFGNSSHGPRSRPVEVRQSYEAGCVFRVFWPPPEDGSAAWSVPQCSVPYPSPLCASLASQAVSGRAETLSGTDWRTDHRRPSPALPCPGPAQRKTEYPHTRTHTGPTRQARPEHSTMPIAARQSSPDKSSLTPSRRCCSLSVTSRLVSGRTVLQTICDWY
jgi:hypothetical protein